MKKGKEEIDATIKAKTRALANIQKQLETIKRLVEVAIEMAYAKLPRTASAARLIAIVDKDPPSPEAQNGNI